MFNWLRPDDTDALVLPDGRVAEIRHTFVRSAVRPALGAVGAFDPAKGTVLWSTGLRDECLGYGSGADTLASLCEKAALLPCGPERSAARDAYLAARKFLRAETIGRVLAVEPETPDPVPGVPIIWTLGVEETSTIDFEIALASAASKHRRR